MVALSLVPIRAPVLGNLITLFQKGFNNWVFLFFSAYVANRVTDKLTKITNHIYCCRSGSAADTQAIADIVNYHLEFHE